MEQVEEYEKLEREVIGATNMPTVKKQTRRKRPAAKGKGVAGRIKPVGLSGGVKLLAYGRGKTGKTRLASTFPKKVLIIGTEDGTRSVSNVKGVDFVQLERSSELDECVELLEEGKYASACLDHAGGLQDLIIKEHLGMEEIPKAKFGSDARSWGLVKSADWGPINAQVKKRIHTLLSLAKSHNLNIVIIAHERTFNSDSESDLIFPTVGAALTPGVVGWLNGTVEYICQTFIREETKQVKVTAKTTRQQPTGKAEYCLRIGPHPVFMTGFRVPVGVEIPDVVVDPSYSKIRKYVEGG